MGITLFKLRKLPSGETIFGTNTGLWNYYYNNGQKQKKGSYTNFGRKSGEWELYHPNGKMYQIQVWDEEKLQVIKACFDNKGNILQNGTFHYGNGTVLTYDRDGNLTKETTFKNGMELK